MFPKVSIFSYDFSSVHNFVINENTRSTLADVAGKQDMNSMTRAFMESAFMEHFYFESFWSILHSVDMVWYDFGSRL